MLALSLGRWLSVRGQAMPDQESVAGAASEDVAQHRDEVDRIAKVTKLLTKHDGTGTSPLRQDPNAPEGQHI
jgi:hypothetical protein